MSSFRATEVEFRQRFWIIFAIFFLSYGLYNFYSEAACLWLVGLFAHQQTPAFTLGLRLLFAAGALLVAAGGLLRAWGVAYLGAGVMRDRDLHAEKVTADGPFRFVRNPLYVGNILLALGHRPHGEPAGLDPPRRAHDPFRPPAHTAGRGRAFGRPG